jgi:predicted AlkP superfamily phosphohydrolase/phosphomutase
MSNKAKNKDADPNRKRTVIFGIDGATWKILKPMIKKNNLPNLQKLMKEGVHGSLRSVNPPVTFPAWATMLTGKAPATLGAFYFLKPTNDYELKVSPIDWQKWNPIWNIYSKQGKKVCVFNIPTTTAYKINGNFISGPIWGEDFENLAYPKEFNEELKSMRYLVRPISVPKISGEDVFLKDLEKITKIKFKLFYKFYKEFDWDLFIMSFNFGDTIQHHFWKYFDKTHPKYVPNNKYENVLVEHLNLLDQYLGKVIESLPENASLIMTSDHGQMIAHTYVNLNAWLNDKGFLSIKNDYKKLKQNAFMQSLKRGIFKTFSTITKSYSKIISMSTFFNKKSFANLQARFKIWSPLIENKLFTRHNLKHYVDWDSTVAYSLTLNTIYLNLIGREAKGCVNKKDSNIIRKRIVEGLRNLRDPKNDKKIIKDIWLKEEVYPKNPPDDFPDIYINFNEGYINYYSDIQPPTKIFSTDVHFTGVHTLHGIFLAYGPEILAGNEIDGAKLEDIVPTILHLNGLPIPSDIDGQVLSQIFKPGSDSSQRNIKIEKEKDIKSSERDKLRTMKFSKKI